MFLSFQESLKTVRIVTKQPMFYSIINELSISILSGRPKAALGIMVFTYLN